MGEVTKIAWTDHTFNPWVGCTKVSAGCANCYAETLMDKRYGRVKWGKDNPRVRTSKSNWNLPLRWDRVAKSEGVRRRVFCASLADVFDADVPWGWRNDLFVLIQKTPDLDWQLLTKRPENVVPMVTQIGDHWLGNAWLPNLWIGTSVEDQANADLRIPRLITIPAKVRFLSVEPLLGTVDLEMALEEFQPLNADLSRNPAPVQWVIVGGESGPKARPCNIEWIRSIVRQCREAGVPCFVKQIGSHPIIRERELWQMAGCPEEWKPGDSLVRMKIAHPKGGDQVEWPEDLRVREFPR